MVQHTDHMNEDYKTLFRTIGEICLLKRSPSHVPESADLQRKMLFLYVLTASLGVFLGNETSLLMAFGQAILEALLLMLFMYLLLNHFSFINRFKQTTTALYASGTLISLISTPFVYQVGVLSQKQQALGLLGWLVFIMVCWSFVVMAHIIRCSIQKNLMTSLLLSFCYVYLSYQLISRVFPLT